MYERSYCVYIMTNLANTVLYTGVTGRIEQRIADHKGKEIDGFTSKYNVCKLVYYEGYQYVEDAIAREKQIKGGSRAKKIALIESENPAWKDLYEEL